MKLARRLVLGLAAAGVATALAFPALAGKDEIYNSRGVAINGTDTVAYFTNRTAVKGSPDYTHEWKGVVWRFSSAENRGRFAADPERYAPQYGGYCAYAVANNYTASTKPIAWHIEDGKLYLNYNRGVRAIWRGDIPGNIKSADANWPGVLSK